MTKDAREADGAVNVVDEALPLLIFDGDCGFCTWSVHQAQRWVQPRVRIEPWQRLDLAALGLTAEECSQSVYWVNGDVTLNAGRAVAAVLMAGRMPWPVAGRIMETRVMKPIVKKAYYFVAAHRYRLPGATPACAPGG
ncbi:MAG: DUF393 domain-containing protein [Candidatus Nanopelagicales bacterium]|jgi:predicted DCC family thiol-disulfide oxidoreductase YuxK|nr:DUF393 domain-containing protein [Candidatus Nanopelagicales bacterium]